MATYSAVVGGTTKIDGGFGGKQYVLKQDFNLATLKAALKGSAFAQNDVLEAFNIPANTFVHGVALKLTKAEGAACTIDVGDADDADGFLNDTDLNGTAPVAYWTGAVYTDTVTKITTANGGNLGKFYTVADTIDITFNTNSTDVATFTMWVFCTDLS